MSIDYLKEAVAPPTQREKADPSQVMNNAGGYTFVVDDWARLRRFLVLGAEGGTYYASEKKLARENAACVERLIQIDGPRLVRTEKRCRNFSSDVISAVDGAVVFRHLFLRRVVVAVFSG